MLKENQSRKCEEALLEVCVPGDLINSKFLRELLNVDIRNASSYLAAQEKKGRLKLIGKMPHRREGDRGKRHVHVFEVQDAFFNIPAIMRSEKIETSKRAGGMIGRSWESKDLPILNPEGIGL